MNVVNALIGTVIFMVLFGGLTYFMERRKLLGNAVNSAIRGALIAGAVYFVLTLILQQLGYV